jgi:hypothetical protein
MANHFDYRHFVDDNNHLRLVPSETQCLLENISLGRTDALSVHRLFLTVLSLSQPFNARYAVEYPLFAWFLALCRARIITIPTIRLGSLHTKLPKCKVRIVFIRARHCAKIRAKSLIVLEKTIVIIAHLCSEMAVFGRKSCLPASFIDPILNNKACCSFLLKESNCRPDRVSDG